MARNQFEQVDEIQQDALNFTLRKDPAGGEIPFGQVQCSAACTQGRLPKGYNSGEMLAPEAYRAAIKFANDFKLPIVVIDADSVWPKQWGELYRVSDEVSEDEDSPPAS